MVLVGVQPSLTQVPATCSRSIMAVFHPARASALESGVPACPEPITIASYCVGWVISVYLFFCSNIVCYCLQISFHLKNGWLGELRLRDSSSYHNRLLPN